MVDIGGERREQVTIESRRLNMERLTRFDQATELGDTGTEIARSDRELF